jgi:hypothetical protein
VGFCTSKRYQLLYSRHSLLMICIAERSLFEIVVSMQCGTEDERNAN